MSGTAEYYRGKLSRIDETIKNYCERQNISVGSFANLLNISESTLRMKRRGASEFTLFEVLKLQKITGEKILPCFDEPITAEPSEPYKVSNKQDKKAIAEKIKDAIPAPVFNYYITIS